MKKLRLSTLYSQQDAPWKDKMLGHNAPGTKYTIGNFGCLITAVDVYLLALGINIDVDDLNDKLKQNGGYQNGGLFIFDSLKNIWPDIKAEYISPKWNDAVPDAGIKKMYELLDQGKYLVTEVDFYPNTVDEDMHWVGIYGYDDQGEFLIFDPWTGKLVPLSVYGEPKRVIYCYRTYNRTLPFDNVEPVVCHPLSKNEELIKKATGFDEIHRYLELAGDPKDTPVDTIKSVIGGYKARMTDLDNQLKEAKPKAEAAVLEAGKLKDQLLQMTSDQESLLREYKERLEDFTYEQTMGIDPTGYVYIIEADGYYKVGKSVNPDERISQHQTSMPYPIKRVVVEKVRDMNYVEHKLKYEFRDKIIRGEWFSLAKSDLEKAKSIIEEYAPTGQKPHFENMTMAEKIVELQSQTDSLGKDKGQLNAQITELKRQATAKYTVLYRIKNIVIAKEA